MLIARNNNGAVDSTPSAAAVIDTLACPITITSSSSTASDLKSAYSHSTAVAITSYPNPITKRSNAFVDADSYKHLKFASSVADGEPGVNSADQTETGETE